MPDLKCKINELPGSDFVNKHKIVICFLLMLIIHVSHLSEEIWGRFWIMNIVGLGFYLIVNCALFCIPVILFYFVLNNYLWAYKLSIIYAAFMVIQGIGHNIGTIITGRYFDGFAGGYSGIGLVVIGSALIYYLLKGIK